MVAEVFLKHHKPQTTDLYPQTRPMKPRHYRARQNRIRRQLAALREQRDGLESLGRIWVELARNAMDPGLTAETCRAAFEAARKIEQSLPAGQAHIVAIWGEWGEAWSLFAQVPPVPSRVREMVAILDAHLVAGRALLD